MTWHEFASQRYEPGSGSAPDGDERLAGEAAEVFGGEVAARTNGWYT